MPDRSITAGERLEDIGSSAQRGGDGPNLWSTLGYRRTGWSAGESTIEWDATAEFGFVTPTGHVIQGGLVTAILDAAMGGACWTVLNRNELFMTADLRVEFFRPTRPGLLIAKGEVLRRTSKVVFCAAELFDENGQTTAMSRCTQVVLAA